MKKEVKGDIFIIPNYAERLNSFCEPEWIAERCERLVGVKADSPEEKMVQVWIVGGDNDNWKHFGGFQKEIGVEFAEKPWGETKEQRLLGFFPEYIPAHVFKGKKEGDTIEFTCPEYGVKITLTCRQLEYRYRRFGRFEEALAQVLS